MEVSAEGINGIGVDLAELDAPVPCEKRTRSASGDIKPCGGGENLMNAPRGEL